MALAEDEPNVIVNGGFTDGLTGWSVTGNATPTKGGVTLSPGTTATQRYSIPGERIVYFGAHFGSTAGKVVARCLDAAGEVVMTQTGAPDPKKLDAGVYFKTQGKTVALLVSMENPGKDPTTATEIKLIDYDRDRKDHGPTCNLDEYMRPFWKGETVYSETILPFGPSAKLLFQPVHVLGVRNSALTETYKEGKDYVVQGREIVFKPDGAIKPVPASTFPTGNLPWYTVAGKHVVVTYTHRGPFHVPIPELQTERLPGTVSRLKRHEPLTVVAYGDSITLGINVSGYRQEAPYMPTWAELFTHQLAAHYKSPNITLYNAALGGMASDWGAANAREAVASLKPDLVTISFGMNDFWWIDPDLYRKNIRSIMDAVRKENPRCEFILISPIHFDPAYTNDKTYNSNFNGYPKELESLAGPGVAYLDMDEISLALYAAKRPMDLTTDPMHPDDFLARWYAQCLAKILGAEP